MQRMASCWNAIYLLVAIVVLRKAMVHCEPEPTRRIEVSNWEDLQKFLDRWTDSFSLNGKARYGKRGEISSAASPNGRNWDAMGILDVSQDSRQQQQQQHRQPNFEQRRLASRQFLRELESSEDGKHVSRPYHMLDIVEKYYDGAQ